MIDRRARSIQGLPGKAEDYPDTLHRLLKALWDEDLPTAEFLEFVQREHGTTRSSARSVLYNALRVLGFVECDRVSVGLTETGLRYVESPTQELIQQALIDNVFGIHELLEILERRPRRIGEILPLMQQKGFAWESDWQVRYRLKWLRTAGLVQRLSEAESSGRYPEWSLAE